MPTPPTHINGFFHNFFFGPFPLKKIYSLSISMEPSEIFMVVGRGEVESDPSVQPETQAEELNDRQ